jgi:hypothetical protein
MKPEEYPITPPQGIFHFPQGIMCLIKQEDTGPEGMIAEIEAVIK